MKEVNALEHSEDAVRALYDKISRTSVSRYFWYLDALSGRATENSIYRKRAIASLNLTENSTVLDVACGIGLNFKILESYLGNNGRIVGVDLSPQTLKLAKRQIAKQKWTNIELVNMSITDYEPGIRFDAALCTFAMEIIPDYKAAFDKIFHLLKPQGKFAMIGMKLSSRMPYKLLNPPTEWYCKLGGADRRRGVDTYIKSRCSKIDYEDCFFDFCYILSTSKSCLI